MIDPALVTLLGGAGGVCYAFRAMLKYIDRERDRKLVRDILDKHKVEGVDAAARGLRALRWRDADDPEDKPMVEVSKPQLAIEAPKPKPDPPLGDEPNKAA